MPKNDKETEFELDPRLNEIVKNLKDTPLDEPTIFAIIDKNPDNRIGVVELALKGSDLKVADFPADQMGAFYFAVRTKITNLKGEDGFFKETKNTQNIRILNFNDTESMMDFAKKVQLEKNQTKKAKMDKELVDKAFELSGLNKEDLSEWEIILVQDQILESIRGTNEYAVGRHIKN